MEEDRRRKVVQLLGLAKALRSSMDESIHASAPDDVWKYSSFRQFARKYNEIATRIGQLILIDAPLDLLDLEKIPAIGSTHAMVEKEFFETIRANLSILIAFVEDAVGVTRDEVENLINFLSAKLRHAIFETPEREVDVQNAIEQLLIGRGDTRGVDYDRETGRTKVSVKESTPDFIFPRLSLALEVKLSKQRDRLSSLVEQMSADVVTYSTKYSRVLFVVYDVGTIQNEVQFKSGIEKGHVSVVVVKH